MNTLRPTAPQTLEIFQIEGLGLTQEEAEQGADWLRAGLWDTQAEEELKKCDLLERSLHNLAAHLPKELISNVVDSYTRELRKSEVCLASPSKGVRPHSKLSLNVGTRCLLPPPGSIDLRSDTATGPLASETQGGPLNSMNEPSSPQPVTSLPIASYQRTALLFVDISGFTKLSTILQVESFSKAINTYFEIMIKEVNLHGGDIVKFAGDGLFAAWPAPHPQALQRSQTLEGEELSKEDAEDLEAEAEEQLQKTLLTAAKCGARIVGNCSDYLVPFARSSSNSSTTDAAVLNLHCGLGVGSSVTLQVGEDWRKRTSLVLGEVVEQVCRAGSIAVEGELVASPEALRLLTRCCHLPLEHLDIEHEDIATELAEPCVIARKGTVYFNPKMVRQKSSLRRITMNAAQSNPIQGLRSLPGCDLQSMERIWHILSLYVHPVVRQDERESLDSLLSGTANNSVDGLPSNFTDAELRSVYTMFIRPIVDLTVTGDPKLDRELLELINDIMNTTTIELDHYNGHLINYLFDDKGLVLVAAFGLRGSTSVNMVADKALPATLAIANALEMKLGVEVRIGATLGMAYCGVVGGHSRFEYSVLGASVNLAARLMTSRQNTGLLVDEAVRKQASSRHSFRSLSEIEAKGYEKKVPIFEPLNPDSQQWKGADMLVGREDELMALMEMANPVIHGPPVRTKIAVVSAAKGLGKSSIVHRAVSNIQKQCASDRKKLLTFSHVCQEQQKLLPFIAFRSIFIDNLNQYEEQAGFGAQPTEGVRALHSPPRSPIKGVKGRRRSSTHERQPRQDRSGSEDSDISLSGVIALGRQRRLSKCSSNMSSMNSRSSSFKTLSRSDSTRSKLSSHPFSSHSESSSHTSRSRYVKFIKLACKDLGRPSSLAKAVGSRFLGLDEKLLEEEYSLLGHFGDVPFQSQNSNKSSKTNTSNGSNQSILGVEETVEFLVAAFLRCKPEGKRCVLAVDDIQWMDPVSWRFLQALYQQGKGFLILLTSWPFDQCRLNGNPAFVDLLKASGNAEASTLPDQLGVPVQLDEPRVRMIQLSPLTAASIRQLAAKTFDCPEAAIDQNLCEYLLQQTRGLPFFAGEILKVMKRETWKARTSSSEAERLSRRRSTRKSICTPSSFTSIDQLLLDRLDGLSNRVRKALQLCAILGSEIQVQDLRDVEPLFSQTLDIKSWVLFMECLQTAVAENILVQVWSGGLSVEYQEDLSIHADPSLSFLPRDCAASVIAEENTQLEGRLDCQDSGVLFPRINEVKTIEEEEPDSQQQFSFRFSHEIWRDVVLGTMLDSQKREIHRSIAEVLEHKYHFSVEEEDRSVCPGEVSSLFVLFGHWRDSGDTSKAVSLALSIGSKFEQWGLSKSALALYDEALAMFQVQDDEEEGTEAPQTIGGVAPEFLLSLNTEDTEKLVHLQCQAAVSLQNLEDFEGSSSMFKCAYDVLRQAPQAPKISEYQTLRASLESMFCEEKDCLEDAISFEGSEPAEGRPEDWTDEEPDLEDIWDTECPNYPFEEEEEESRFIYLSFRDV